LRCGSFGRFMRRRSHDYGAGANAGRTHLELSEVGTGRLPTSAVQVLAPIDQKHSSD
jgi:hypothetical protein